MRKSRFTQAQIVGILQELETGAKLAELCRRIGVSKSTTARGSVPQSREYPRVVESFNRTFRDECLSEHWFVSLTDAQRSIAARRTDYECERPHRRLRVLTRAFARTRATAPFSFTLTTGPA